MEIEEQTKLADSELSTPAVNNEESVGENVSAALKPFLLGIAGLALVLGILVLLPMFFTYISEGNVRPPSQIHPADPAGKSDHTIYTPAKSKR